MTGDDRESASTDPTVSLTRRQLLRLAGGGTAGTGIAKVAYEYTGFGAITGTNLTEQPLARLARHRLGPSPFTLRLADRRLVYDRGVAELRNEAGDRTAAVAIDAEPTASGGLPRPLSELVADLSAIESGEFAFEFSGYEDFFGRLRGAGPRPFTVAALRGGRFRQPTPETVRRFSGVDPATPASLVTGLAEGFEARTHFDYARYVAGAIQKLLLGTVPLKASLREPTHLGAILDGSASLYCYEYALRSIEAFHTLSPHRQATPVFGALVLDDRHDHSYTGLASVVREDGELRVPMTFLDYFYSTLFENAGVRGVFGEGIDAYDEHHRASDVYYRNLYGR